MSEAYTINRERLSGEAKNSVDSVVHVWRDDFEHDRPVVLDVCFYMLHVIGCVPTHQRAHIL